MHEEAKLNIRRKVKELILACEVSFSSPTLRSVGDKLTPLIKETMKHKSEWMSETDVYLLLLVKMAGKLKDSELYEKDYQGPITSALTLAELTELINETSEFINSVPRSYTAYLQLPKTHNEALSPLRLSDAVEIVKLDINNLKSTFRDITVVNYDLFNIGQPSYFLSLEIKGFASYWNENPTTNRALSQVKTIVQMGIDTGVFSQKGGFLGRELGIGAANRHSLPKSNLIFRDNITQEISELELELEIGRTIHGINFNWVENLNLLEVDVKDKNVLAQTMLADIARLSESNKPEAAKIRSAIGWLFDSNATINKTMSLLQACIGLEAILGDNERTDSITDVLADRCAYIISEKIEHRPNIKKTFKSIYKTRSKIVHGTVNQLSGESAHHGRAAKELLEKVIAKELTHLKL